MDRPKDPVNPNAVMHPSTFARVLAAHVEHTRQFVGSVSLYVAGVDFGRAEPTVRRLWRAIPQWRYVELALLGWEG